jgi:hypothetical protein
MHAIPQCPHASNTSSREKHSVVNTTKNKTPECQDRPTEPVEPARPTTPALPPVPPPSPVDLAHEINDFDNSGRFSPPVFRPMDSVSLDVIDCNPRIDQQFNNVTSMSSPPGRGTTRLVGYHKDTHRMMSHRGLQRCTKLVAKLHRRAVQYVSLAWSRASVGFNKPSRHVLRYK